MQLVRVNYSTKVFYGQCEAFSLKDIFNDSAGNCSTLSTEQDAFSNDASESFSGEVAAFS
ncbi:hypothetical protein HNY73_021666 [Argiope bruennichi]|uniref:Uncharacterized protein n=1 Tax=Argiope bruennichi TaxID=94029 RepID=A0A8T0DYB3_ARGBR|nr:hypothetical protein HNY73_021666 [Argiope bruennichi]